MTLPVGQLARSTFDLHGEPVAIQSLTRKEQFVVAAARNDPEACEILILMFGTSSTREQTEAFRASEGDSEAINGLIKAISKVSGIKIEDDRENGSGPKVP